MKIGGNNMVKMVGYSKMPEPKESPYDCDTCLDKGELKNGESCKDCCPHDDRDHGICDVCGDEDDGSGAADWAYEMSRDY